MSNAEASRMNSVIPRNRASHGLAALSASEKDVPLADFQPSRKPMWKLIFVIGFEKGIVAHIEF